MRENEVPKIANDRAFPMVAWIWLCVVLPGTATSSLGQNSNPPYPVAPVQSPLKKTGVARIASQANFHVLAIGVSRFDDAPDLLYTVEDAKRVAQAYRDVAGLSADQVTLLVDDGESKIDSNVLEKAIATACDNAGVDDTCVIFFSGHGFANEDSFYLVPSNFSLDDPEATGLSLSRLRQMIAASKAGTKMVILDCCHSGAVGQTPMNTGKVAASFRAVPGCVAIAASRSDQLSLETDKLKSGIFTQALVEALRGRANSRVDSVIDVMELFQYSSDRVKKETKGRQSPSISMDQFDRIPTVIPLVHPDRPSDRVGVIPFPLPPSEQTMGIVIDTISRFPEANPRRTIGMCHWVLKHAAADSNSAKQAAKLIALVDEALLAGRCQLGPRAPEEE
jgi:hypothetical protein